MRLLRIPEPDKAMSLYSSEELAIVTDESAEGGALPELQREIIHNIFELEDLTADQLMTSRRHIRAIEHDADRADIAAQIEASPTSRFPVFVDDRAELYGEEIFRDGSRHEIGFREIQHALGRRTLRIDAHRGGPAQIVRTGLSPGLVDVRET